MRLIITMKTNNTNDDAVNIKQKVIKSLESNDMNSFEDNFRKYSRTVTLKDVSPFMMNELRPFIESNPKIIKIIEKCLIEKENEHEELSTMSTISTITCDKEEKESSSNNKNVLIDEEYIEEEEKEGINIVHNNEKKIRYITLNILLKKIALDNLMNKYQNELTGFTHQMFLIVPPEVIIIKIINAYEFYEPKNKVSHELIELLNQCTLTYFESISSNERVYNTIKSFYNKIVDVFKSNTLLIQNILMIQFLFQNSKIDFFDVEYFKMLLKGRKKSSEVSLKYQSKQIISNNTFNILDYSEDEITKQLSYISFMLLSKIKNEELYGANFIKEDKLTKSPNVMKAIEHFDNMILFIFEDIISYYHYKTRAKVIEKWIKVAMKCREINNYNDLIILNTLFKKYELRKLKYTWKHVSKEDREKVKEINKFCSFENNYFYIKNAMNQCIKNEIKYIPYLGILLKEITLLEETTKYVKNNNLINIEKISFTNDLIQKFFTFKQLGISYNLNDHLDILNHISPDKKENLEQYCKEISQKSFIEKHIKDLNKKRKTKTEESYVSVKSFIPSNINSVIQDNYIQSK